MFSKTQARGTLLSVLWTASAWSNDSYLSDMVESYFGLYDKYNASLEKAYDQTDSSTYVVIENFYDSYYKSNYVVNPLRAEMRKQQKIWSAQSALVKTKLDAILQGLPTEATFMEKVKPGQSQSDQEKVRQCLASHEQLSGALAADKQLKILEQLLIKDLSPPQKASFSKFGGSLAKLQGYADVNVAKVAGDCCRQHKANCVGLESLSDLKFSFNDMLPAVSGPDPLRARYTPRELALSIQHGKLENLIETEVGHIQDLRKRASREKEFLDNNLDECRTAKVVQKQSHPLNNPETISLATQTALCGVGALLLHNANDTIFNIGMGLLSSPVNVNGYQYNCDQGIIANIASQRLRDPAAIEQYWNLKDPDYLMPAVGRVQPLSIPYDVNSILAQFQDSSAQAASASQGIAGALKTAVDSGSGSSRSSGRERAENRVASRALSGVGSRVRGVRTLASRMSEGRDTVRGAALLSGAVSRTSQRARTLAGVKSSDRQGASRTLASSGRKQVSSLAGARGVASSTKKTSSQLRRTTKVRGQLQTRSSAKGQVNLSTVAAGERARVASLIQVHMKNMQEVSTRSQTLYTEMQKLMADYQNQKAESIQRMTGQTPKKQANEARKVQTNLAETVRKIGEIQAQYDVLVSAMRSEYYTVQSMARFSPGGMPNLPMMTGPGLPGMPMAGSAPAGFPTAAPPAGAAPAGASLFQGWSLLNKAWALVVPDDQAWLDSWTLYQDQMDAYATQTEKAYEDEQQKAMVFLKGPATEYFDKGLGLLPYDLEDMAITMDTVQEEVDDLLDKVNQGVALGNLEGNVLSSLRNTQGQVREAQTLLEQVSLDRVKTLPAKAEEDPLAWVSALKGLSFY